MKKFLIYLSIAICLITITFSCSKKVSFKSDGTGEYYKKSDGSYATNEWVKINNDWYWFDSNGYLAKGQFLPNGYNVDADGKMSKNKWCHIYGSWLYADNDGAFKRSTWIEDKGKWYYVDANGIMVKDSWVNNTYYVGSDGVMLKNTTTPDGVEVGDDGKSKLQFNSLLIAEYNKYKPNCKFDNVGNLWVETNCQYVNAPLGDAIVIYTVGINKTTGNYSLKEKGRYERAEYSGPSYYDESIGEWTSNHATVYEMVIDNKHYNWSNTPTEYDRIGSIIEEIFITYRSMKDYYFK